uniref:Uncharacterized protein n=1 Tax=Romanomermis culicivorax TaxID=13658 RepID=A0A915IEA6_ROMCU
MKAALDANDIAQFLDKFPKYSLDLTLPSEFPISKCEQKIPLHTGNNCPRRYHNAKAGGLAVKLQESIALSPSLNVKLQSFVNICGESGKDDVCLEFLTYGDNQQQICNQRIEPEITRKM